MASRFFNKTIVSLAILLVLFLSSCQSCKKPKCSEAPACVNGQLNSESCTCNCNTGWKGALCDALDSNDNYYKAGVNPSGGSPYDFSAPFNNVSLEYFSEVGVHDSLIMSGTAQNTLGQVSKIQFRFYLDFANVPPGLEFVPAAIKVIYIDNGEAFYMERGNEETITMEGLNVSGYSQRLIKGRFNHIQCFNKDRSKSVLLMSGSFYFKA